MPSMTKQNLFAGCSNTKISYPNDFGQSESPVNSLYLTLKQLAMRSRISKSDILSVCIQKQEELIHNFNDRIDEAKAEVTSHPESPSQSDEGSNSAEEMLHVMEQELAFVRAEMNILRGIDPEDPAVVAERGAVVVTDQRIFFIAVSSEEVDVHGQKVFGMSEKAPLYKLMKGQKTGDTFQFNDTKYKILDIY